MNSKGQLRRCARALKALRQCQVDATDNEVEAIEELLFKFLLLYPEAERPQIWDLLDEIERDESSPESHDPAAADAASSARSAGRAAETGGQPLNEYERVLARGYRRLMNNMRNTFASIAKNLDVDVVRHWPVIPDFGVEFESLSSLEAAMERVEIQCCQFPVSILQYTERYIENCQNEMGASSIANRVGAGKKGDSYKAACWDEYVQMLKHTRGLDKDQFTSEIVSEAARYMSDSISDVLYAEPTDSEQRL